MSKHAARGRVGIRDVALAAGVSMASVSRVLNAMGTASSVRPDIVERVHHAAEALQYRPNPWARSLRTTRTSTVGVIVPDLSLPFAVEMLQVIYAECRKRDCHVLVDIAEDEDVAEATLGGLPSSDRVDGVIVVGGKYLRGSDNAFEEAIRRLIAEYQHVVTVASHPSAAGESSIIVDNAAGVTLAMEHLIRLGHRTIAHIRDDDHTYSWEARQRFQAFSNALRSHALTQDPALEVAVDPRDLRATQDMLERLCSARQRPTAVFVDCDVMAITVLRAALLSGIRVPADLSVVGFDDIEFAALCTPGLTTVHQPIASMGTLAVAALFDRVAGESSESIAADKTVVVAPTLVVRESCGPPGQGTSL